MNVQIEPSWKELLADEFGKEYFQNLVSFVKSEYQSNTCYPPGKEIFSAFDYCQLEELKVVIIGQDPYHGIGQANGLCFSVADGVTIPRSLKNIFKEIESDLGKSIPSSGNLKRWAEQGVLLINATLTVRAHQAGSHQKKGWEEFTDALIGKISDQKEGVVFLLWGAFAQNKGSIIDSDKHCILFSPHPSPFSANRGFFGNKHFSKTNAYLKSIGKEEVNW